LIAQGYLGPAQLSVHAIAHALQGEVIRVSTDERPAAILNEAEAEAGVGIP